MRRTRSTCLAISAALLLAALPVAARTRPHYGGALRVETRAGAADSDQLRSLIAESLTALDDQGRVLPLLADRWESQNGDRRWVFMIHPLITMHDGAPLTGKIAAQLLSSQHALAPWRSVQGTGTTLTFDCDSPAPNLPALLASSDFAIVNRLPDGTLVGTGPFRATGANSANATLDVNENFWQGRAYVDRVELFGLRPIRSQWLDLSVGRADVAEVPGEFLRRAQQDHLRTTDLISGELILIVASPDIADINLRHALSASIDRASLGNVVFQKQGQPAATLLPNSMTGYAILFPPSFDPAIARDLRSMAKSSSALTISYDPSDPTLQLAAERIVLNARDAGFVLQAIPRNVSASSSFRLLRVTLPSTDPAACLAELSRDLASQNISSSEDLVALYQQERSLLEQWQLIPLLHLPAATATSDRVRDNRVLRELHGIADVWIGERR